MEEIKNVCKHENKQGQTRGCEVMNGHYSIAILLSAYNGDKFIRQQIESILNQQLKNGSFELFIRDDGSIDDTVEIIKEMSATDNRIHLIEGKNIGYIASFLTLLYYMKEGQYFYDFYSLSDQDDVWDSEKLQAAIDVLESESGSKPMLYQATTRVVDKDLNFIKMGAQKKRDIVFYNSMIQTHSPGHTYVLNRELLCLLPEGVDASMLYGHDAMLTNLAAIRGKVLFDNIAHNDYRQHGNNQLGTSGNSMISWMKLKYHRVQNGDGKLYAKQIRYLTTLFKEYLSVDEITEVNRFFSCQSKFILRVWYALSTKFYRQTFIETLAFKLLYILGGYNL